MLCLSYYHNKHEIDVPLKTWKEPSADLESLSGQFSTPQYCLLQILAALASPNSQLCPSVQEDPWCPLGLLLPVLQPENWL